MQIPQPVPDFAYYNGANIVHADRLAIFRQILIRTRGKPNELTNRVFGVPPDTTDVTRLMESWEAAELLVQLVREVFHMVPFNPQNGSGARDEHCWAVWKQFCDAMDDAKKKTVTSPTTSQPTAETTAQATMSTSASS